MSPWTTALGDRHVTRQWPTPRVSGYLTAGSPTLSARTGGEVRLLSVPTGLRVLRFGHDSRS